MKILIVACDEIFAEGLATLIKRKTQFSVNAVLCKHELVLSELRLFPADLLLVDMDTANIKFMEEIVAIQNEHLSTRILVVSKSTCAEYCEELINAGIYGFIEKNAGIEEIIVAVNKIVDGEYYFGSTVTNSFSKFKKISSLTKSTETKITQREKEVLRHIVEGSSTLEISKKLFVSKFTIDSHRKSLLGKLGVRNAVELTRLAIANNLV